VSSPIIVTYHAVDSARSRVTVTRDRLQADLLALGEAGYACVTLDDIADWLERRRALPARAAAITFDDGYASLVSQALPVLATLKIPATVFVIAGRLGQSNRWPGQPAWVPEMPLVDVAGLREIAAAGIAIGSHSWTHARLGAVGDDDARREILEAASGLEDLVRQPVAHFAYPYGERTPRDVALAAGRFRTAVTAESRVVAPGAARHELPRIDAHDLRVAVQLGVLGSSAMTRYLALRRGLRQLLR